MPAATDAPEFGYVPIRKATMSKIRSLSEYNTFTLHTFKTLVLLSNTAFTYVPQPIQNVVVGVANPLIDSADRQLEWGYNLFSSAAYHSKTIFNHSVKSASSTLGIQQWFATVNNLLGHDNVNLQQNNFLPFISALLMQAGNTFLMLANTENIDYLQFELEVKSRLGSVWNPNLHNPCIEFFDKALVQLQISEIASNQWTTSMLIAKVKPTLSPEWEISVINAFKASIPTTPAEQLYLYCLQQYMALKEQAHSAGLNGVVQVTDFLQGARSFLDQQSHERLEVPLNELFTSFSESMNYGNANLKEDFSHWQWLLAFAQYAFDGVLPANIAPELLNGNDVEELKDNEADPPISLYELAVHIKDRLSERSVVGNIMTASANVTNTIASPVIDRLRPYAPTIFKPVDTTYNALHTATAKAYHTAIAKLLTVKVALQDLLKQTRTNIIELAQNTQTSVIQMHSSIPSSLRNGLSNLQVQLNVAVSRAHDMKDNFLESNLNQLRWDLYSLIEMINNSVRNGIVIVGGDGGTALLKKVDEAHQSLLSFIKASKIQQETVHLD